MTFLRSLKRLCLINIRSPDWFPGQVPLDHSVLPQLTQFVCNCVVEQWIHVISSLRLVEALGLHGWTLDLTSVNLLSRLDKLQNLRVLSTKTLHYKAPLKPQAISLLQRLESLQSIQYEDLSERQWNHVRELSPFLKIEMLAGLNWAWLEDNCH